MTIRSVLITVVATVLVLGAGAYTCYKAGYKARVNEEKQERLNDAELEQQRLKAQQELAGDVLRGLADWSQNTKIVEIRHEKTNTIYWINSWYAGYAAGYDWRGDGHRRLICQ